MSVAILGLLVLRPLAIAQGNLEDEDPTFVATCNDGQQVTGSMPCDIDDHVDGVCTFGERGGKNIRVPVGQSKKLVNSCDAVGLFTCDPPAVIPPKIIEPGKSPATAQHGAKTTPRAKVDRPSPGSCAKDSDCVPTSGNGCVARSDSKDLQDPGNTNVRCRCFHGPVAFGCVPRGSDWESFSNRLNRK